MLGKQFGMENALAKTVLFSGFLSTNFPSVLYLPHAIVQHIWASMQQNLSLRFLTKQDSNQFPQLQ